MNDPIKPPHYHPAHPGSDTHCHHAQLAQMGFERMLGYHWGNIIKYVWRWERKNGLEDLKKAKQHIEMMIELMEKGDGYERRDEADCGESNQHREPSDR